LGSLPLSSPLSPCSRARAARHEKTIYQQIFPAQIPPRRLPGAEGERRAGGSTTSSSTSSAMRDANAFPSSYALDHLFPPSAKTRAVYEETVQVRPRVQCWLCWLCCWGRDLL
jgi:hypothetical protein